jgi:hypothetical protein
MGQIQTHAPHKNGFYPIESALTYTRSFGQPSFAKALYQQLRV